MPSLAPILDNAEPPFAMVIVPGFYLHYIEVVDQDPANDSLLKLAENVLKCLNILMLLTFSFKQACLNKRV